MTPTDGSEIGTILYKTRTVYKVDGKKCSKEDPQLLWCDVYVDEQGRMIMASHNRNGGSPDRDYPKVVTGTSRQTPKEQAYSMADAKITKKLKKDYVEGVHADNFKPHPTLAHRWDKFSRKMTYPCIVQPKLDGVRCIYDPRDDHNFLLSRGGETYKVPYVLNDIRGELAEYFYDGELYCKGVPLQEIIHIVRSGDAALQKKAGLGYYIWDMMEKDSIMPYNLRLKRLLEQDTGFCQFTEVISSKVCANEAEVDAFYRQCIIEGHEGVVVKSLDAEFSWGKRLYGMLKRKELFDAEFRIKRVVMDVEDVKFGKLASYECLTEEGKVFKVTPAMDKGKRHALYEAYMANYTHLQGQMLTCEYRGVSNDGIPLHCVGKTVRPHGT